MLFFIMRLSHRRVLAITLIGALQLAVAIIDFVVPDEVPVSHLQYIPIILAAAAFGYRGVLPVVASSGLIFYLANFAERANPYTLPALALTEALYLGVGWAATHFFSDQRRLQALAQARVELAVAEERARLAREIHDTAGQSLLAVVVQSEAAALALHAEHLVEVEERLDRINQQARDSLGEVRRSVLGLSPSPLEQYPLPEALHHLAERLGSANHTMISFSTRGAIQHLPANVAAGLYRIGQEALANAIKHSRARQIEMSLDCEEEELLLTVSDDGQGFDTAPAMQAGALPDRGFGLVGMEQRAQQLGAVFNMQSVPGKGTRVRVVIPLAALTRSVGEGNSYSGNSILREAEGAM